MGRGQNEEGEREKREKMKDTLRRNIEATQRKDNDTRDRKKKNLYEG